jgi:hypothetical protein
MASDDPFQESDPHAPPEAEPTRDGVGPSKTRGIDLSVEDPFLAIWTRPRATIRGILDTNPSYLVLPLAMAWGVMQALGRVRINADHKVPLADVLIPAVLLGLILGLIALYIGGALLSWAGHKLGGHGNSAELRAALAWSHVPELPVLILVFLRIALIGRGAFASETPIVPGVSIRMLALMAAGVIQIILTIWAFVTLLKCIGEAHGFSAWRAWWLLVLAVGIPLLLFFVLMDTIPRVLRVLAFLA